MNRAILRTISSSSRIIPRIYASSKSSGGSATASVGPSSGNVEHHVNHDHDHDHGHGHHHEPELRKTQAWRHHSGIQSKYENQGEDPTIAFMQERPNYHDYRPAFGQVALSLPYRTHAQIFEMWLYHAALVVCIWLWWYVIWRFIKEPSWFFGHAHYPDMSKFTDEELGIPPDDLD